MAQVQDDPLADLRAELAAEAQAEAAADPKNPPAEAEATADDAAVAAEGGEPEGEEGSEAQAAVEGREAKKKDAKAVPVSRFNEEAVKRRQAQKRVDELERELEAVKNPQKTDPSRPRQPTIEELREQIRAEERFKMQIDDFVGNGYKDFGQEQFDAASKKIADLIAGDTTNIVNVALEAAGTPKLAAKALYLLGQGDASEIEAFLALSPLRQAAAIAKLASSRIKGDEEPARVPAKAKAKARVEEDEEPPAPLRPIKGGSRVPEGLGDDVPEDVWFDRFEKTIMNNDSRRH